MSMYIRVFWDMVWCMVYGVWCMVIVIGVRCCKGILF